MSVRKEWIVHRWGVMAERRRMEDTDRAQPLFINAVRLVESDTPNNREGVVTAVDLDLVSLECPGEGAVVTVPLVKSHGSDTVELFDLQMAVDADHPWIYEPVRILNGCIIRAKLHDGEITDLHLATKKDFERAIVLGFHRNLNQAFPEE